MNNSETMIVTSAEDAFTTSRAYLYQAADNNLLDEPLQNDPELRDDCCSDQLTAVECIEGTTIRDGRGAQQVKLPPRSRGEQPDLGLWLLHGSPDRHDEWERLRGIPAVDSTNDYFGCQYSSSILKRGIDVVGSLLFLVLLFPLFILIAVAIKLDSRGPIFFRHDRVGKDGKAFLLWKFRSMRTDVPKYEASPRSVVDVRLTRIGRFIRRLSIDEIPQLINVLRGEMSLVGPRPEMPFIVAQYHPVEYERLNAKPGITGLWQISPARAFPIHENLQYDLHYIRNQNLLLDCAILVRTITAVIRGVGAV
jgi:lipopolysaccharide/colanic/teichoic acid biosynthesis glycosyltransferase